MKPTQKQIDAEIIKLEEMKPRIPRTTFFGDDNWESVEGQIEVLREDLDEDAIYNRTKDEGEDDDSKLSYHSRNSMLDARSWMDGDSKDSPSKNWKPLVK